MDSDGCASVCAKPGLGSRLQNGFSFVGFLTLFQPATTQICPSHSRRSRNKQTKSHRLVQTSAYISTHMLLARSRHVARELHFILKLKGEGSGYLLDKTVVHCNVLEGDKFYGGGGSRIGERLLRIWED